MNLILWRHAQAEEGSNDLQRHLTDKGRKQARHAAHWLLQQLNDTPAIWVSEALRSQETAAALKLPQTIVPLFNPESAADAMPAFIQRLDPERSHIIVGHQPWIGQLAALLLNEPELPSQSWRVKKSAIWWFDVHFNDPLQKNELKAVLSPEFFPKTH